MDVVRERGRVSLPWVMCLFSKAAVPKYHKLVGLNDRNDCLTVLETRSPRLRRQQGCFLPGTVNENVSYASHRASGGLLAVFGVPWLVKPSPDLFLYIHMAFTLCACLCVQVSPFIGSPVMLD